MSVKGKYSKELKKIISDAENIIIVSHMNPDGDAIGSMLALFHYLRDKGKNAEMISPNGLQHFLLWMDGTASLNVYSDDPGKCQKLIAEADLIIMVDFNDWERLGKMKEDVMRSGAFRLLIDHHPFPSIEADLLISDTERCSTSELLHILLREIDYHKSFSKAYFEAVYTGIITDTGNFEHGSFNSNTMTLVGEILDSGIDREMIFDKIYNNFSESRMRLQGYAVDKKMELLPEFGAAFIWLTREELRKYHDKPGDTEGFVNIPLSIKGVAMTALFIEKDDYIKASFRSKGNVDVRDFSSRFFNGGGHRNAAGGELYKNMDETIEYFRNAVRTYFWENKTTT